LKIDNMREQHTNKIDFTQEVTPVVSTSIASTQNAKKDEAPKEMGFISVSAGKGLSDIFKDLGVDEVIEGGQTMNPSTEDILNAIEKINATKIVVLPNNKNIILAAEQAAELTTDKKVYVVPSKTIPEGICALFNYEDGIDTVDAVEAMTDSMEAVKTATVTYAVRDTSLDGKEIKEGDILGMLGGKIAVVAKDIAEGTKALIDQTVTEDNDMVSVYYGADVTKEDAMGIFNYIKEKFPECETELHCGDQPLYYYIISAE